jgi:hypothetical protein
MYSAKSLFQYYLTHYKSRTESRRAKLDLRSEGLGNNHLKIVRFIHKYVYIQIISPFFLEITKHLLAVNYQKFWITYRLYFQGPNLILKIWLIVFSETSVTTYKSTFCNTSEERRSHSQCGGSTLTHIQNFRMHILDVLEDYKFPREIMQS